MAYNQTSHLIDRLTVLWCLPAEFKFCRVQQKKKLQLLVPHRLLKVKSGRVGTMCDLGIILKESKAKQKYI